METELEVLMMYHRNLITYQNKSLRLGVLPWGGCSLSGEGLLSKGAIFTSLFSSNKPEFDDLNALF